MINISYGSPEMSMQISNYRLECYVLKTGMRVFSFSGIQKTLGYDGKNVRWLINFIESIAKFQTISSEYLAQLQMPLACNHQNMAIVQAFYCLPAADLQTLLEIIISAKRNGFLSVSQMKYGRNAEALCDLLQHIDLDAAIDEATGLEFFKQQSKQYLRDYVYKQHTDPLFLWLSSLPDPFYNLLFQIYDSDYTQMKSNPAKIGAFLIDILFSRLPDDIVDKLRMTTPKRNYKNKFGTQANRLPDFLQHFITPLFELAAVSGNNRIIFGQLLNRKYPKLRFKNLNFTSVGKDVSKPSAFDNYLLRGIASEKKPRSR